MYNNVDREFRDDDKRRMTWNYDSVVVEEIELQSGDIFLWL